MTWRLSTRLALGAAALVGALVSGESVLRAKDWQYQRGAPHRVVWSPERDREMARASDPYRFDPHQLWSPRPLARIPWTVDERFNEQGYRGPLLPVERPKRTLRLAALGGAGALGVGVAQDATFVAVAARLISSRIMACEPMNLGVENFSVRQCLERYRDVARPYRPHLVVVSVTTRASYAPAPGGVTDDENIERYRPLDVVNPRLPPSVPTSPRILQGLHWLRDATFGPYWEDRDFSFHLARLVPTVRRLDWPGTRRVPMNDYYDSLALLLQETRQDGAHLVLLVLPVPASTHVSPIGTAYDRVAVEFAEREKLIILDERLPRLAGLSTDLQSLDPYGGDRFPSACGHAAIAEALADIVARGILEKAAQPPPPKGPPKDSK